MFLYEKLQNRHMKVTAIIETPKGSSEKYNYDPELQLFKLKKLLPAGMAFPYDFGFIPETRGDDGDPLDIIVVSEFKSFPGCAIDCYVAGAILAAQTQDKRTVRNDRFIGIPVESAMFKKVRSIDQLPENILRELEDFFVNYNKLEGKKFKPLKTIKQEEAFRLIKERAIE